MAPNGRRSRSDKEEYHLIVAGVPRNCRWQELKDFLRDKGFPHLRSSMTYNDTNGNPSGLGTITIIGKEDAERAYEELARNGWNGHCISVTLSKLVNGELKNHQGPVSSPAPRRGPYSGTYTNGTRHMSMSSPPVSPKCSRFPEYSSAASRDVYYAVNPPYPTVSQVMDVSTMAPVPYHSVPAVPMYTHYPTTIQYNNGVSAATQTPHAMYNTSGLAYSNTYHNHNHNTTTTTTSMTRPNAQLGPSSARVVSTCRTVFLSNLPYTTAWQTLKDLLQKYGHVERCNVPKDMRSPNKIKGIATAEYATSDQAARAISSLNGRKMGGVVIRAKFDCNGGGGGGAQKGREKVGDGGQGGQTATRRRPQCEGPLIVNGSRGVVRRGGNRDRDDDDGDEYDDEAQSSSEEDVRSRSSGRRK